MILFDTGPIVAAAFTTEDYYEACTNLFAGLRLAGRRLLLPATVSAEAGYLIDRLGGPEREAGFLSLGEDRVGLSGSTGAGSGTSRAPKLVAMEQVLERLNDLFGDEEFSQSQKVSFLQALMATLTEDEALLQQARVNKPQQFVESPEFDDAVTGAVAVADNQGAHNKMADYFFTNGPGRDDLVVEIANWFYKVPVDEGAA